LNSSTRRRNRIILGFVLLLLGASILWFGWEEAILYSEVVYTRPGDSQVDEFSLHIPPSAQEPFTVLVALHPVDGTGQRERLAMRQIADERGWVLVSPTFRYGRGLDPAILAEDDRRSVTRLAQFLDQLPLLLQGSTYNRVLLYGFSRGAQTAHRFALVYPERVARAAVASGGTYTLPTALFDGTDPAVQLDYPYGVADFRAVFNRSFDAARFAAIPFWIGVGEQDTIASEIPREWDLYLGSNRVERAQRFASLLDRANVRTELEVFPRTGHTETPEIRAAAVRFLAGSPPAATVPPAGR
jgi:pimeloyl-ACP methyl ester carboxylesterase